MGGCAGLPCAWRLHRRCARISCDEASPPALIFQLSQDSPDQEASKSPRGAVSLGPEASLSPESNQQLSLQSTPPLGSYGQVRDGGPEDPWPGGGRGPAEPWPRTGAPASLPPPACLLQQSAGPVEVAATVAGGQGREGTEGPPPHYSTSNDLKFSYSEINFQDLSWSFRNLYKSMLEKSSSSQHGEPRGQTVGGGVSYSRDQLL